mmetsp:Transcript_51791/g.105409  ORF Transcript_51791/g.105409 Transcript_51791/m.105409 type:complete len:274 (-) Transcript_51791:1265-2086(-)
MRERSAEGGYRIELLTTQTQSFEREPMLFLLLRRESMLCGCDQTVIRPQYARYILGPTPPSFCKHNVFAESGGAREGGGARVSLPNVRRQRCCGHRFPYFQSPAPPSAPSGGACHPEAPAKEAVSSGANICAPSSPGCPPPPFLLNSVIAPSAATPIPPRACFLSWLPNPFFSSCLLVSLPEFAARANLVRNTRGDSVLSRLVTAAPNCVLANPPGLTCVMRVNSVLLGSSGHLCMMFAPSAISMRVYPPISCASGWSSALLTTIRASSPSER